jgi:hypothetical protein
MIKMIERLLEKIKNNIELNQEEIVLIGLMKLITETAFSKTNDEISLTKLNKLQQALIETIQLIRLERNLKLKELQDFRLKEFYQKDKCGDN